MKSLLKISSVLAITLILTACGSGETTSSDLAGNTPTVPDVANHAPAISGTPITAVDEGVSYSFTPVVYDADGDLLSFSVSGKPAWASFNASNGRLSGTPDFSAADVYPNIVISVSDGELSATLPAFSITVNDVTQGPVVPPAEVHGAPVMTTAAVSGTDVVLAWVQDYAIPEGGYDVFIDGVDTGTQYRTTATTVAISGLDLTLAHCFNVESRYSDTGEFYSSNQLCTVAQQTPNQAPSITGTPSANATVGVSYSFTPAASDPDGDSLSFSVSNLPAWASFNSGTGRLSGTPAASDEGVYNNILIIVSDGEDSASLAAFSISVNPAETVNQAPTISGTPASTVSEGELYGFTPSAADADGDQLTFSVTNLPAWASFDTTTGAVTGTPGTGDAGVYSNIVIRVTDGTDQVSLAAFSITVNAVDALTGSMSLRWSAPTTRADGSALSLSEIGGYCIYVGTSSDTLEMLVDVNDGATTDYTIDDLAVGTYFVAVTTYDVDGVASSYSNVIEKNVTN